MGVTCKNSIAKAKNPQNLFINFEIMTIMRQKIVFMYELLTKYGIFVNSELANLHM